MRLALLLLSISFAACAGGPHPDAGDLSEDLAARAGHGIARPPGTTPELPPDVVLSDGLAEDEAVALALWNDAAFRSDLEKLEVARTDLVQARLLRNPTLSILFPFDAKQLEFTLGWLLDVFWERPQRITAADVALHRTLQELVARGLDAARDARLAFLEAWAARCRLAVASEDVELRGRLAALVSARWRAGEEARASSDLAQADLERAREAQADLATARLEKDAALASRLGLGADPGEVSLLPSELPDAWPDEQALLAIWRTRSPDLRAAELGIEEAAARLGWERARVLQLTAVLDANGEGSNGRFEAGPGLAVAIPIFDRNQGGRARAHSEMRRAAWVYVEVERRVETGVRAARQRYARASESLRHWREGIRPATARALQGTRRRHEEGEGSLLDVLQIAGQDLDARRGELDAELAARRARADLERQLGARLDALP